jgi:F-type H+-transporting ATPase subunit delta
MSIETVARRYATALADVVLKSGESESVKRELAAFEQMMAANVGLSSAFGNPAIAHAGKEKVLEELIKRAKPLRTTANFLRILLRNSRLTQLAEINDRFTAVLDERSGIVSAQITSARELPKDERSAFEKNLAALTGKKVNIDYAIDPSLIGGAVTRIGSTVYDGSVKTKLENLREQLISG